MRFASAFSIITDQNTRNENINDWIDKIIQYTSSDKTLEDKVDAWVKDMDPHISTRAIISFFEKKLEEAFRKNIHVIQGYFENCPDTHSKSAVDTEVSAFSYTCFHTIIRVK